MRLVCYMDSGGKRSMWEAPACAVHRGLAHSERTGADREMEDMGWSVAAAEEELAVDGAVDVQYSRVAVVGCGAEVEDPAARGGDDAQYNRCLASITKSSDN
jgi:hypothetical protein